MSLLPLITFRAKVRKCGKRRAIRSSERCHKFVYDAMHKCIYVKSVLPHMLKATNECPFLVWPMCVRVCVSGCKYSNNHACTWIIFYGREICRHCCFYDWHNCCFTLCRRDIFCTPTQTGLVQTGEMNITTATKQNKTKKKPVK